MPRGQGDGPHGRVGFLRCKAKERLLILSLANVRKKNDGWKSDARRKGNKIVVHGETSGNMCIRDMRTLTIRNTDIAVIIILATTIPKLLRFLRGAPELMEVLESVMGFRWGRSRIFAAGAGGI